MKNTILNLIKEATSKTIERDLKIFAESNGFKLGSGDGEVTRESVVAQMKEAEEYLMALLTREDADGNRWEVPNVPVTEMMSSSDSSVVMKRVIGEVLIKPREPALFLQNVVAKKITLSADAPLTVTFPVVGAYNAQEVAEGGEYKAQALTFQEHIASLRLKKIGVMASLSEEIILHSIYPLIALNLELMANGINRRVEELLFRGLTQKATPVFDNDDSIVADRTSGVDYSQVFNGSIALKDILKMAGVVVGNKYEPSHLLIHPLAYPVIFQDPLIRTTFWNRGQMGGSIWSQNPGFDQSQNMPFGLSYVPYYALPYNESGVMATAPGSGFASALLTDLYVIDQNNALAMISRGDTEFDSIDDWFKDATTMKARKYINCAAMDSGRGMTVARNVRVVENFQPIMTVRTTT